MSGVSGQADPGGFQKGRADKKSWDDALLARKTGKGKRMVTAGILT